jgi:hypothetical protein
VKQVLAAFVLTVVGLVSSTVDAHASPLSLTPANTSCISTNNSNLSGSALFGILDQCFDVELPSLSLLYKAEVGGGEEGPFAASYQTTFTNSSSDPENAFIQYVGGPSIGCMECYLVVKDGNHQPAQYFFDLSGWNGTQDLDLTKFWPQGGAISNVAIWGSPKQVPEPGTLLLLGTSGALALLRRRRAIR